MLYHHTIQDVGQFVYDTVTDGQTFRVQYHKSTPRWSGKWYWLKHEGLIAEFLNEESARAAIFEDTERRLLETERWESAQVETPAHQDDIPHQRARHADDTPF